MLNFWDNSFGFVRSSWLCHLCSIGHEHLLWNVHRKHVHRWWEARVLTKNYIESERWGYSPKQARRCTVVQKSEKLAKSRKKSYLIDCFNIQNSFSGTPDTTGSGLLKIINRGRCLFTVGLSLLISRSENAARYARLNEKQVCTWPVHGILMDWTIYVWRNGFTCAK